MGEYKAQYLKSLKISSNLTLSVKFSWWKQDRGHLHTLPAYAQLRSSNSKQDAKTSQKGNQNKQKNVKRTLYKNVHRSTINYDEKLKQSK